MTDTPCRACGTPKPSRLYLCPGCWQQLPAPTRHALNRRDSRVFGRLRALHRQLDTATPLPRIEIR